MFLSAGENRKYLLNLLDLLITSIRVIGASETTWACIAELCKPHVLTYVPIAMSVSIFFTISIHHLLGHASSGNSLLPDYYCRSSERLHHILVRYNFTPSTSAAFHLVPTH